MINVIIPIGGIGQRFREEGYVYPKPLINILGKPMISRVLEKLDCQYISKVMIIYTTELCSFNFESLLRFHFPKIPFQFVCLKQKTIGAAQTIFFGLSEMSPGLLEESVLVMDCDTFYDDNIIEKYNAQTNRNCLAYFNNTDPNPIFSYIKLDKDGSVVEIAEKKKISDNANTGAYGFQSGDLLKTYCSKLLQLGKKNELYTSFVYDLLLKDGIKIGSIPIKDFVCLGTPLHVKTYCRNNVALTEKLRICFDLDNTLVSYPQVLGDYSTVRPIERNVNLLRYLKSLGHTIIIHTARHMKTANGNVNLAIQKVGKKTMDSLEKLDIPYDELHFGKPYAHFYIDDLAINANLGVEQGLGIYNADIPPRHFNTITMIGDKVVKTTSNDGETYFYTNIPQELSPLFPKVFSIKDNTIEMENIKGISYSYLYINQALSLQHITDMLSQVQKIHTFPHNEEVKDVYANYLKKLQSRKNQHRELYGKFDPGFIVFDSLAERLQSYEQAKSASLSIIHGDLVFTNIFLLPYDQIKFIDMRGKVGDDLTIYGDRFYDYAKIYQSVVGYDFILHGKPLDPTYISQFEEVLRNHLSSTYGINCYNQIRCLAASLFYSLLPLHTEDAERFEKYMYLVKELLI